MNFLIDTNICSAYIKGNHGAWSRFLTHSGSMAISVITAGELWTWAKRSKTRSATRDAVNELLQSMHVIEVDMEVALQFGELRAKLLDAGTPIPDMDTVIAATALVHDMTLVTNNTKDFLPVSGLKLVDWLAR